MIINASLKKIKKEQQTSKKLDEKEMPKKTNKR